MRLAVVWPPLCMGGIMKIGIGIDTGGTCTDGVLYDMEGERILSVAKTPTTKEDLSIGIGRTLDLLNQELLAESCMVSLSTTLATNACVEGKGGRGKLIFLGMDDRTVKELGAAYGLPVDDTLIFIECKETLRGEILHEPDWQQVKEQLRAALSDCQAVGIVELFADGTGAALEKKTRQIVEELGLPTVCGYELFAEKNVIGRGAGALLNARLIFVIAEFLQAVKDALRRRGLSIPMVIVRSDGSLMSEHFSLRRPIETLLCGPVASVMGAAKLHQVKDGVIVDMGGTTTDISLIKNGVPLRCQGGITVGDWKIYLNGMYVDTFGLGGDSEVILQNDGSLTLGSRRIMPISMAAARYPSLLAWCRRKREAKVAVNSWRQHLYVGLKDISADLSYTVFERRVAKALFANPLDLALLEETHQISLMPSQLKRLIEEGVVIRCGITPTDAMHVLGDYNGYETQAAVDAIAVLARLCGEDDVCAADSTDRCPNGCITQSRRIYKLVEKKLYCGIARVLLWDKYPRLKQAGVNPGLEYLVEQLYEEAAAQQKQPQAVQLALTCEVPLVGVGGPIGVFLQEVAALFHTKALLKEHSHVANALGAIVGNVEVCMTFQLLPQGVLGAVQVVGSGVSLLAADLDRARQLAAEEGRRLARAEAVRRGANEKKLVYRVESDPVEAVTDYGTSLFLSEKISVYAQSPWTEEEEGIT